MLIFASSCLTVALIVAAWGVTSLTTLRFPIETSVPNITGPAIVILGLLISGWSMWQQSLHLLRGNLAVPFGRALVIAVAVYLLWSIIGMLAGLHVTETWASIYALELIPVFLVGPLCCWWLLYRRVYTDRPTPQWPWEKNDSKEREIDELNDIWHASSDEGDENTPPEERL